VRSTSHFWSKLYELSTPSHLLYGTAGGGSGGADGSSSVGGGGGTSSQVNTMAVGSYTASNTNSNMPSTANSATATPNSEYANPAHSPRHTTYTTTNAANNTYHTHEYSPGTSPAKYRTEGSTSTPYDYSPDTSPFGSRAGTPVGSPAPASKIMGMYSTGGAGAIGSGGIAANTSNTTNDSTTEYIHPSSAPSGTTLRKMISRHSSRSLVMSRSQLERGRLLELCLSVLGCSAQWHLQLLANRYMQMSCCLYEAYHLSVLSRLLSSICCEQRGDVL